MALPRLGSNAEGVPRVEQEPDPSAIHSNDMIRLRRHLGLGDLPGQEPSGDSPATIRLFFIEKTPWRGRGPKCSLSSCFTPIGDTYRVAVSPGSQFRATAKGANYYHIKCLEEIADLSRAEYLDRIGPVTRNTYPIRGLEARQVLDGDYLCEGGVEKLVIEWKMQRGRWIDEEAGLAIAHDEPGDFIQRSLHEQGVQLDLNPVESDGPSDVEPWSLYKAYLNPDDDRSSWHNGHHLSQVIEKWNYDSRLACATDRNFLASERDAKSRPSQKALKAIKRLSSIPMPDTQSMFFGGTSMSMRAM